jgi:hypothetical protein
VLGVVCVAAMAVRREDRLDSLMKHPGPAARRDGSRGKAPDRARSEGASLGLTLALAATGAGPSHSAPRPVHGSSTTFTFQAHSELISR